MQAFDIEQLRTFVQVVDAGSVTAGAALVHLSQSAASEQLKKLEERAGHMLLVRSKSGVLPTDAGLLLLAHARRLLALSDEAWRDLHGVPLQGDLKLAITDYFRPGEVTQLLSQMGKQYPGVRLHVTMGKSRDVEAQYASGHADIAICMRVDGKRSARATLLRNEALRFLAAPGYSQDKSAPLKLVTLGPGCTLRTLTEKLLGQRKIAFTVVHVANGVAGMQSALAAGLGVACLNESALCDGVQLFNAKNLRLPTPGIASFQMLGAKRDSSPLVMQVRDLLVQHFS